MHKKKAFTLIELMIVITIIGLISMLVYAPYSFFQKKAEVKIAAKNITKTLNEARNNAIFGISDSGKNQSVGVFLESGKNIIKIYNYPYDFGTGANIKIDDSFLKEEINIGPNILINKIEGKNKVLFLYSAIYGKLNIFEFDTLTKQNIIDQNSDNIIEIDFGYKGVNSGVLFKKIKYYTKTFISDY